MKENNGNHTIIPADRKPNEEKKWKQYKRPMGYYISWQFMHNRDPGEERERGIENVFEESMAVNIAN